MLHQFPRGYFTLSHHHAWLWADAVKSDPKLMPHPGLAILVAFRGAGTTIAEVMAHIETTPQHVQFGELDIAFEKPLRIGSRYSVDLAILLSERKTGRSMGVFDLVTLRYAIIERGGDLCTELVQRWVVARPQGHPS
jgi:hypothetical protein